MEKIKNRYWSFLKQFISEDVDIIFIFFGIAVLIASIIIPFGLLGEENHPLLKFALVFGIPVAFGFIFQCLFIFPLVFAFKEVRRENEFNKLVVDCLKQIGELRDGMEPGQVYHISKGYSCLRNDVELVKGLIEKSLGSGFQVRVECHAEVSQYRIEMLKLLELPEAATPSD